MWECLVINKKHKVLPHWFGWVKKYKFMLVTKIFLMKVMHTRIIEFKWFAPTICLEFNSSISLICITVIIFQKSSNIFYISNVYTSLSIFFEFFLLELIFFEIKMSKKGLLNFIRWFQTIWVIPEPNLTKPNLI